MDEEWTGIGSDDDEDDYAAGETNSGRDSIVFLIDCSEDMMVKMENEQESAFTLSMKCALTTMKSKIISSEKDLLGVVFYGTREHTDPFFKHVYAFQKLQQLGVEPILAIEKLLKESKESFAKTYGHGKDVSFADALWVCGSLFSECNVKLSTRRILLFTNEENPHPTNSPLQKEAIQKAKDLLENDIDIELLPISKNASKKFNASVFYKTLLCIEDGDADALLALDNPSEKFNELLTRVRLKNHKKRTTSRIPFNLPGGIAFSVGIYNLALPLKKSYPVKVAKNTNEPLQLINKTYCEESGEIVMPNDITFYQEYATRTAHFEKGEIAQLKQMLEPGFNLLGFERMDALQVKHHKSHAAFIYPDETTIRGSIKLFTALLRRCLDRKIMPIGWLTPRKSSLPALVALLPQEEEKDSNQIQSTPPGFHAIFIPFADDSRNIDLSNPTVKAEAELIDKAKQIIKKLKFRFDPTDFENPVLQKHWRNIEALALDADAPDILYDCTLPKEDVMEKRAGQLMEEFQNEIGVANLSEAPKRKAPFSNTASKKRVKEEADSVIGEDKAIDKMTVAELKDFIARQQLDIKTTSKKKAELQQEIRNALNI